RACVAVRDEFLKAGGTYRTGYVKPGPVLHGSMVVDDEDGTRVEGDGYVFACGPWLGQLLPEVVGKGIRPTRQEVFYFGTPRGSERYLPGHLPVWIDFG